MFKKTILILSVLGIMIPSFVLADEFGLDSAAQGTALANFKTQQTDVPTLIGTIVGVVLSFLGAIFFLLILYAGFLWMTAFGAPDKADKAKGILEHAAIGLLIVLGAYAISRFVFSNLPGGSSPAANQPSPAEVCLLHDTSAVCVNDTLCKWLPAPDDVCVAK